MSSLQYINSKLSDAIYILTIHPGDARARLSQVIPKIQILSTSSFPHELQKDVDWVKSTIQRGLGVQIEGVPTGLTRITNSTASKVIAKIVYIQDKIESQLESD
jgi:hypothetical protein